MTTGTTFMSAKAANSALFTGMPLFAGDHKLLTDTARLQAQAYRAAMLYQIEMLSFLKHRYEKDVQFVDDLVASDGFNDAFDVVAQFLQSAATEYTSEAGKVAKIGSKLGSEAARNMRRQANEMVEDLAAKTVA